MLSRISGKPIEPRYVAQAQGGTPRRIPDISRARKRLGFDPRVGLEDGLRVTYRWYSAAISREREGYVTVPRSSGR